MNKRYSLIDITKTLCNAMNIQAPKFAKNSIDIVDDFVLKNTDNKGVDKIVVYNPDAIGEWVSDKYADLLADMRASDLTVQMRSMIPPKTPVCFGSIYTGATPEQHGITHYEKKTLTIDSYFDALVRANKKACIVSVKNQSMDILFRNRQIDYYSLDNDKKVVEKAIDLIKNGEYDVICIYNQEYDDMMHRSHPKSLLSKRALKHYNESYKRILQQIEESYKGSSTLYACITDHGVHREWYGLGSHGKDIDKDMNVLHHYSII